MPDPVELRVAIVHPFLIGSGGGEKVIDALAQMFPRAEFFTLMMDPATLSPALRGRVIHTTFLDRGPLAWRYYQHFSPLYDLATARHDLRGFDLVISSGGPAAKTARVPGGILHVHYCHSPVRFLWDQYDTWLSRLPRIARLPFQISVHAQRRRDLAGARRVDRYIANSHYIAARIRKYYERESIVVYPPVALSDAPPSSAPGDYYLSVGRLVPNKRTELLIEACNALGRRLIVAGGGPEFDRLKSLAGPTVEVVGRVSDAHLDKLYVDARAFLFAADEDFGIATVEAQSRGLPAIAYAHGGSLEILSEGGIAEPGDAVFFREQEASAIEQAILRFEEREQGFDRALIQRRAQRFDAANFVNAMREALASAWPR